MSVHPDPADRAQRAERPGRVVPSEAVVGWLRQTAERRPLPLSPEATEALWARIARGDGAEILREIEDPLAGPGLGRVLEHGLTVPEVADWIDALGILSGVRGAQSFPVQAWIHLIGDPEHRERIWRMLAAEEVTRLALPAAALRLWTSSLPAAEQDTGRVRDAERDRARGVWVLRRLDAAADPRQWLDDDETRRMLASLVPMLPVEALAPSARWLLQHPAREVRIQVARALGRRGRMVER